MPRAIRPRPTFTRSSPLLSGRNAAANPHAVFELLEENAANTKMPDYRTDAALFAVREIEQHALVEVAAAGAGAADLAAQDRPAHRAVPRFDPELFLELPLIFFHFSRGLVGEDFAFLF